MIDLFKETDIQVQGRMKYGVTAYAHCFDAQGIFLAYLPRRPGAPSELFDAYVGFQVRMRSEDDVNFDWRDALRLLKRASKTTYNCYGEE
jgi:hypothetical protein